MLNNTKDGLEIFDRFRVDKSLPKYDKLVKPLKPARGSIGGSYVMDSEQLMPNDIDYSDGVMDMDDVDLGNDPFGSASGGFTLNGLNRGEDDSKSKLNWWSKIKAKLKKEDKPKISVVEFFRAIKGSIKDVQSYEKRVGDYITALKYAKQLGQTALVEQLKNNIVIAKYETLLLQGDFKKVITEEQVISFYKDSAKGLSLTYVENFARIIPSDIVKLKKEADKLCVFDNYVIMHYDPNQKAFKLTKKQVEAKKDPILFGIIKGIRKMYYIGDWQDEFCDLTLDAFIEKFGKDAIDANNISVKFKL